MFRYCKIFVWLCCIIVLSSVSVSCNNTMPSDAPNYIYTIKVLDIENNTSVSIASDDDEYYLGYNYRFTPDSNYLTNGEYICTRDGANYFRTTPSNISIKEYCFDNQTTTMYFITDDNKLYTSPLLSEEITLLNQSYRYRNLSISTDDGRLVLVADEGLFTYGLVTNAVHKISSQSKAIYAIFNKEDNHVLYDVSIDGVNTGIYNIDLNSGVQTMISPIGHTYHHNGDRTKFVFNYDNKCWLFDTITKSYEFIHPFENVTIGGIAQEEEYGLLGSNKVNLNEFSDEVYTTWSSPRILSPSGRFVAYTFTFY